MKQMKREEVINKLVEDSAQNYVEDIGVIADLLRYGHDGFENYTNKQLEKEWEDAYYKKIKVVGEK